MLLAFFLKMRGTQQRVTFCRYHNIMISIFVDLIHIYLSSMFIHCSTFVWQIVVDKRVKESFAVYSFSRALQALIAKRTERTVKLGGKAV